MPSATGNNNPTSTVPLLSLPSAAFSKVAPVSFLTSHLASPEQFVSAPDDVLRSGLKLRPNLRRLDEFRRPVCNTSSLNHCSGSAVVRAGETTVVCGVQPEILLRKDVPDPPRAAQNPGFTTSASSQEIKKEHGATQGGGELERLGLLVPNVELATGCSPAHVPMQNRAPTTEAQSLAYKILRFLHITRIVNIQDLRITERSLSSYVKSQDQRPSSPSTHPDDGQSEPIAYWTLHLNIQVLSLSGTSSLVDIVWSAVLAALRDTLLPRTWWDEDRQMIVCSERRELSNHLQVNGLPVAMTWGVFEVEKNGVKVAGADADDSANKMDVDKPEDDKIEARNLGEGIHLLADPDSLEEQLCIEILCVVVDCSEAENSSPRLLHVSKSGGSILNINQIGRIVRSKSVQHRWRQWASAISARD